MHAHRCTLTLTAEDNSESTVQTAGLFTLTTRLGGAKDQMLHENKEWKWTFCWIRQQFDLSLSLISDDTHLKRCLHSLTPRGQVSIPSFATDEEAGRRTTRHRHSSSMQTGTCRAFCFNRRWSRGDSTAELRLQFSLDYLLNGLLFHGDTAAFVLLCLCVWECRPAFSVFGKTPDSRSAKLKNSHLKFMTLWREKWTNAAIKMSSQCRPTGECGWWGWRWERGLFNKMMPNASLGSVETI